ncbi:MAG: 4-vinyl reductase [Chloroflexota bacterium]
MSGGPIHEGLFYPNRWVRIILETTEDIVGEKGMNALLNLAGLSNYVGNYPPDDMKKEVSFADVGKLQDAYWQMYGDRGARAFAIRSGAKTFNDGLERFGKVAAAARAALKIASVDTRISKGLAFFAQFFNTVSDQKVQVTEDDQNWYWHIVDCPMCAGRTSDKPVCHLAVGVLQAAMANFVDKETRYVITQTQCQSMGHDECLFQIEKQ